MAISTTISETGRRNITKALSILKSSDLGLDKIHLAAIGGNISQECGGNVWAYNNFACAGMCQWGGRRPFGSGVPAAPAPYSGAINTASGMNHVNAIVSAPVEKQAYWLLNEMKNGSLSSFSLARFKSISNFNQAVAYFCFHYEVAIDSISSNHNLQILQARCIMGRRYFGNDIPVTSFSDYDFSKMDNGNNNSSPPIILPEVTQIKIPKGDFNDSALDFDTITDNSDDLDDTAEKDNLKSIFLNTSASKNSIYNKTTSDMKKDIASNEERSALQNESKCTLHKEESYSYTGVPEIKAASEQITHPTSSGGTDSGSGSENTDSALDFDTIFENETNNDI